MEQYVSLYELLAQPHNFVCPKHYQYVVYLYYQLLSRTTGVGSVSWAAHIEADSHGSFFAT